MSDLDNMDGFSKQLFENLLRQINEQAENLDRAFGIIDILIAYLKEKDPEFIEIVSAYTDSLDFVFEMEGSGEEAEEEETEKDSEDVIVHNSIEDNLDRSIPFNVAHMDGDSAGGFYNPVRGCMCTPFDCPFNNDDCEIIQIIKQQKAKEDNEDQHIPPQE